MPSELAGIEAAGASDDGSEAVITIEVLGTPAPKGSGRAMLVAGRPRVIASGSTENQTALRSWDTAVRAEAKNVVGDVPAPPFVGRPLRLTMVFRIRRPGGHYGKGKKAGLLLPSAPRYPITKPDKSKLERATEDSLIGIVFDDDSRIVETHSRKVYASPGNEGATITVEEMPG